MKPFRNACLCGACLCQQARRQAECACLPPQRGRRGLRNGATLTLLLALALLGLLAASLSANAQQPARTPRIGILRPGSPPDPLVEEFKQGLRELGYVEGQNLSIEYRWAEGREERLSSLAAALQPSCWACSPVQRPRLVPRALAR